MHQDSKEYSLDVESQSYSQESCGLSRYYPSATRDDTNKRRLCYIPVLLWNNVLVFSRHLRGNRVVSKLLLLVCVTYSVFIVTYGIPSLDSLALAPPKNTDFFSTTTHSSSQSPTPPTPPPDDGFSPEYGVSLLEFNPDDYQFDWKHWVNITDLPAPDAAPFKFKEITSVPFYSPPRAPGSTSDLRRVGQTFLKHYAAPPAKVVVLATGKSHVLKPAYWQPEPPAWKKMWQAAMQRTMELTGWGHKTLPHLDVVDGYQSDVYKVYKEIEKKRLLPSPLQSDSQSGETDANNTDEKVKLGVFAHLDKSSFVFNVTEHSTLNTENLETEFHTRTVKETIRGIHISPKHFYELWLSHDAYLGLHYDWRFFRQLRRGEDAKETLHHLVHAWSAFTANEGLLSWLAHGALIGWHWNGFTLPWDADIDIQMPISELDRLARKFNNTLVVQDPADGDGRYLIEVGPTYVQRIKGNGRNVIDARFIDTRSGLYLDITGLAYNNPLDNGAIGCKNKHYYRESDLTPLRLSTYEGARVYVPNNPHEVLVSEYKTYSNTKFRSHVYNSRLRLWVEAAEQCDEKYVDEAAMFDGAGDLTFYGACENQDIWERYNMTRKLTSLHERELEFWKTVSQDSTKKVEELLQYEDALAQFSVSEGPLYPSPRYIEGIAGEV